MLPVSKDTKKFNDILVGRKNIDTGADAKWFLNILSKDLLSADKVSSVASSKANLVLLQNSLLKIDYESPDSISSVITFFEYMVDGKFDSGLLKISASAVFAAIYETQSYMGYLKLFLETGKFTVSHRPALACLMTQIIKQIEKSYDDDADVSRIVELLVTAEPGKFVELETHYFTRLHKINAEIISLSIDTPVVAAPSNKKPAATLHELKELVPLHDNDFPLDYRKIAIFPTTDEVNTNVSTFRVLSAVEHSTCADTALLLDRQFRLLREDMLAPIREELKVLLNANPGPGQRKHRSVKYLLPRAITVEAKSVQSYVEIEFEMPDGMKGEVKKCSRRADVEKYFETERGRRVLTHGSILFFISDNSVVNIGVVSSRNVRNFASEAKEIKVEVVQNDKKQEPDRNKRGGKDKQLQQQSSQQQQPPPQPQYKRVLDVPKSMTIKIGVTFFNESLTRVLYKLCGESDSANYLSDYMVQAHATLFSYEPVLKCLQDLSQIPMEEEIVGDHPQVTVVRDDYEFPKSIEDNISRDPSQLLAARFAMKHRVTVIQGPPGTGKTYIGIQIVRALIQHAFDTDEPVRILCLCYTNHALDSFLEELVEKADVDLEDIVRLGSSPKISEMLKQRCLRELEEPKFDQNGTRTFAQCKQQQNNDSQDITNTCHMIANVRWGAGSWETVREFLEEYACHEQKDDILEQLTVPDRFLESEDGMKVVHKKGKTFKFDTFWRLWFNGERRPNQVVPCSRGSFDVWELNLQQRLALIEEIRLESLETEVSHLKYHMDSYNRAGSKIDVLKNDTKLQMLRSLKVIGSTTTSAAKFHDLLQSVAPTVVLVEEAAEILESHILANINESTKQLIMIGDHLQLRPKLEHYPLRKDSGMRVDFDVSLFERMVKGGYPVTTLTVQHRMRPEISTYIRHMTYPELVDHQSVFDREHIRGMRSDVAFISHSSLETSSSDSVVMESSSKVNMFEVDMLMGMVKYLLQQAYEMSDIVILTPYLGQLVKIQAALKALHLDAAVGDLDRGDIQRNIEALGPVDLSSDGDSEDNEDKDRHAKSNSDSKSKDAPQKRNAVRVATIDNYQGEESKIILASLVRSNPNHEIGFMSGPERVNVLFSRARDGFYILGNPETFRSCSNKRGREMWNKLLDKMENDGRMFGGFPVICKKHSHGEDISTPAEFSSKVPNGGCNAQCDEVLPTCPLRHRCKKVCHASDHSQFACREEITQKCAKNLHNVVKLCSAKLLPNCKGKIRNSKCPEGHPLDPHDCSAPPPDKCKTCAKILLKKAEEEEKLLRATVLMNEQMAALALQKSELQSELNIQKMQLEFENSAARQNSEMNAMAAALEATKSSRAHIEENAKKNALLRVLRKSDQSIKEVSGVANASKKTTEKSTTTARKQKSKVTKPVIPSNVVSTSVSVDSLVSAPVTTTISPESVSTRSSPTDQDSWEIVQSDATNAGGVDDNGGSSSGSVGLSSGVNGGGPGGDSSDSSSSSSSSDEEDENDDGESASDDVENSVQPVSNGRTTVACNSTKLRRIMDAAYKSNWGEVIDIVSTLVESECIDLNNDEELLQLPSVIGALYLFACLQLDEELEVIVKYITLLVSVLDAGATLASSIDSEIDGITQTSIILYVNSHVAHANKEVYSAAEAAKKVLDFNSAVKSGKFPLPDAWYDEMTMFVENAAKIEPPAIVEDNPSAANDWEAIKQHRDHVPSKSLDTVMKMVGLESIKRELLSQYNRINIARKQGMKNGASNYNSRFDGNPGTGKTTVARLYSTFLIEVGILAKNTVVEETTGASLKHGGVGEMKRILGELKAVGGGVVFVDEAYQLNDNQGHAVLDFILAHATELNGEYGAVVWIFAGYTKMLDKLFEHNIGLPSRFPTKFVFEDYTFDELVQIFSGLMLRGGQDVQTTAKVVKVKQVKPSNNPINIPSRGYNMSTTYSDVNDEWGNVWKYNTASCSYDDPFGNTSGYGPKGAYTLGSRSNPVVSKYGNEAWIFERSSGEWYQQNDPQVRQKHYPGSVAPVPVLPPPKPFTIDDSKWIRVAMRRLARLRNTDGFGNARAVRTVFDRTLKRHAVRLSSEFISNGDERLFKLVRDDLLGPKATEATFTSCKALQELDAMEGLKEVNESVRQLLELIVQNADREDKEKPVLDIALNRIFLGNPGTGKTTVAKLYAKILTDFGLLSKGEVVMKFPSDFIGNVLGSSESQTRAILESARGSVLVIDEAYGLCPDSGINASKDIFKESVITTLVEQIQGVAGEDRAVLLLGYRANMEQMMDNCNPGLARRFQLDNAIVFNDFTDSELVRIMRKCVKRDELKISMPVSVNAVKLLAKNRNLPNFGNAGDVNNILTSAKLRMQMRLKPIPVAKRVQELLMVDFEKPKEDVTIESLFGELVGCTEVLDKIKDIECTLEQCQEQGIDPVKRCQFSYIFTGSPGTGKTTVARLMGKIFHKYGLIASDEVVDTSPSDFVTGYIGQAGKKTNEILTKARGKVLFIDEAYGFDTTTNKHTYMDEVVTEIVKALTSEEYMGKMVVIMAGYKKEMESMLNSNAGLRSRFKERVHFDDFSTELVNQLIHKRLVSDNLELSPLAEVHLTDNIIDQLRKSSQFANGRDINTFCDKLFTAVARRNSGKVKSDADEALIVEIDELDKALNELLKTKQGKPLASQSLVSQAFASVSAGSIASPPPTTSVNTATTTRPPPSPPSTPPPPVTLSPPDDEDRSYLSVLQDILDREGLNSADGAKHLSTLSPDSREFIDLANEIKDTLGMSYEAAEKLLLEWQTDQANIRQKMEEQKREEDKAREENREANVPIWRCAVCGRADKPFIVCFVAPFILRYEKHKIPR